MATTDPVPPARAPGTRDGPVADALDAIAGLTMRLVAAEHDDVGRLVVRASFGGWSPSLHLVAVEATAIAVDGDMRTALKRLEPMLARQRRRAADGRRLGLLGPLQGLGMGVFGHLHVDRTLAACHEEDPTLMPLVVHIDRALGPIHRDVRPHDGGPVHANDHGVVAEATDGDGAVLRMVGPAIRIMPDGLLADRVPSKEERPTYDGVTLRLPAGHLPDTVLHALPGRTVGELARTHPLLAARRIHHARHSADGRRVVLALELDPVPISTL